MSFKSEKQINFKNVILRSLLELLILFFYIYIYFSSNDNYFLSVFLLLIPCYAFTKSLIAWVMFKDHKLIIKNYSKNESQEIILRKINICKLIFTIIMFIASLITFMLYIKAGNKYGSDIYKYLLHFQYDPYITNEYGTIFDTEEINTIIFQCSTLFLLSFISYLIIWISKFIINFSLLKSSYRINTNFNNMVNEISENINNENIDDNKNNKNEVFEKLSDEIKKIEKEEKNE